MSSPNSTGFKTLDNFAMSFIYKIKSSGPNIDHYGTPHFIFIYSEYLVSYDTYCTFFKVTFEPVTWNASYTIALEFS